MPGNDSSTIFLIGPRGCGKSTLAPLLARLMDLECADTDLLVTEKAGMSLANFVAQHGWDAFRQKEAEALRSAQARGVVATGGGIVLLPENRAYMRKHGLILYLCVSEEVLFQRLRGEYPEKRPPLKNVSLQEEIALICAERESIYRQLADYTINANASPQILCDEIYRLILFDICDI